MDKSQNRESVQQKYDIRKLLRLLLPSVGYALLGAASGCAALPFGALPFGIALLAAANKNALFIYLGLAFSCLLADDAATAVIRLGIYTSLLLIRALVALTLDDRFKGSASRPSAKQLLSSMLSEAPLYRCLSAALAALALGSCSFFGGGLLYYDLFGLLISVVIAPLAAILFYGAFEGSGVYRELGMLAIFAASVFGIGDLKLYGVSISLLAALMITLFITDRGGLGRGCVTGLVLGLVYSPILSPSLVLAALCAGIFMKISPTLSYFTAFISSSVWAFYIKGIYALDGIFGALLSACLLYSAARRLLISTSADTSEAAARCSVLPEGELDSVRLFDMNRRMSAISEGLSDLSSFFEQIKLRYPRQSDLIKICSDAFESSCSGCSMERTCPQRRQIDSESVRLSSVLRRNRGISPLDLDRGLVGRCSRLPDILDEINYNSGLRSSADRPSLEKDEVFAPDYRALSRLLERSMEDESGEYTVDSELSRRLCRPLDELGAEIDGVLVYGKRRRTVYIKSGSEKELCQRRDSVVRALESHLPFSLDTDSVCVRRCSDNSGALSVSEAESLRAVYVAKRKRAREEISFCGDSVSVFENRDKRFFAVISDGMGSGREAAAVSEICTRFMESMLTVGRMNGELLSMLGGFLSGRCEGSLCECSATVDLMETDLITGSTVFFKSGAAPTYIYRNGDLFKLRSRTMPIGILPESESKRYEFSLSEGDVVIMLSDGVTGGEEECPWLFDLLRQNVESSGIERTAELIVKYAVGHGSEDDISVVVVRMERA